MHATDIVAYTFNADIYCEHCIAVMFEGEDGPSIFDGPEEILDWQAHDLNIDRYDESSFDSSEFPKVVFADSIENDDYCGNCHERIID